MLYFIKKGDSKMANYTNNLETNEIREKIINYKNELYLR